MAEHHFPAAILCDLDGVIRNWDRLDRSFSLLEAELGLPERALLSVAFQRHHLEPVITGKLTHAAWVSSVHDALASLHGPRGAKWLIDCWLSDRGEVNSDVLVNLRTARATGSRIVLVTNATDRLNEDLAHLDILDDFDAVVNSSVIGVAKPDTGIYLNAVEAADVALDDCVFIDDKALNVTAAQNLGIAGIQYDDPEGLRESLSGLGGET